MPNVEILLPASIGESVHLHTDVFAGQVALVVAWRLTRPRFLLGGAMDGELKLALLVLTDQSVERWVPAIDVRGQGDPTLVVLTLPFLGSDDVTVHPARKAGVIRGWEVTGRRLETQVRYRVHVEGTPPSDDIEVDARYLEPRPRTPRAGAPRAGAR